MCKNKAKIILIEGPDGSGKGTIVDFIHNKIKDSVCIHFPNGEIRQRIMQKPRPQKEIIELFAENFKQNIPLIQQYIKQNKTVIIDRMYISTLVYGLYEEIPANWIIKKTNEITNNFKADYEIILTTDPLIAQARLNKRVNEKNWLDGDLEKMIFINNQYLNYYENNKNNTNILLFNSSHNTPQEMLNDFDTNVLNKILISKQKVKTR